MIDDLVREARDGAATDVCCATEGMGLPFAGQPLIGISFGSGVGNPSAVRGTHPNQALPREDLRARPWRGRTRPMTGLADVRPTTVVEARCEE